MKGFIVALRRAKDEDIITTVLTEKSIKSYYRFYGSRHSILQLGNLIDFEIQDDNSRFMPRIRGIRHMGFSWLHERNRLSIWHDFIKLFEPHLRDTEEIDNFYFNLLLSAARKWDRQNPKRVICESYLLLLKYEGRLAPVAECYICQNPIKSEVALMSAFKPAHPECIYSFALDKALFNDFIESGKTIYIDDSDIEQIYSVIMKGL